jgi:RimJ/RimL family protein N-acetyltransferase
VVSERSLLSQSSRIQFRWTTESDLDAVLRLEQGAENRSLIIPWTREQHREACSNSDLAHLIIETRQALRMIGFLLLAGRESPHHSIEFRRIVIADKGRGYGKAALKLVKQVVFEKWKAHRLWLDVFDYNHRARHVYASEGFIEVGVLRECVSVEGRFESLVVMSLLAQEYVASQSVALNGEEQGERRRG